MGSPRGTRGGLNLSASIASAAASTTCTSLKAPASSWWAGSPSRRDVTMNRVQRTVRALAAPASLLLACAGAWASEHDEHKLVQNQPDVIAESPAGLPFAVAGAMTAPPTKFAVISMIGPEGKAGAQMLASEGAVVAAYRVVSIHADRVVFERDGHTFFVRVGTERQDPLTPTTPFARTG